MMIREARLRAGLSQGELSERSGKDRAQIARWERDVVQPSFETLRDLARACGFDLEFALVPYEADEGEAAPPAEGATAFAAGAPPGDAEGAPTLMPNPIFDPLAILRALDQRRVSYIVIGALGRVIQGSDEVTDGVDIVPSTREENLRKLGLALEDLNARRVGGKPLMP